MRRGALAKRCAIQSGMGASPFKTTGYFWSPAGSISPAEILHERGLRTPTIAAEEIKPLVAAGGAISTADYAAASSRRTLRRAKIQGRPEIPQYQP
jgi:hypothetical protein